MIGALESPRPRDSSVRGARGGLLVTARPAQSGTHGHRARHTGLRYLRHHGATIYEARKRIRWPGRAAVVVSVVHVHKGALAGPYCLDGREVEVITAFLFHTGPDEDPEPLKDNEAKSFQGCIVLGLGFTFADDDPNATSLTEMERLIAKDPRNASRIRPYLGGEELNESPTFSHQRYVIDFGVLPEHEAREGWPDLMEIVERKVKPERERQNDRGARERWWQFIRPRPELAAATESLERVLAVARVSATFGFTFLSPKIVLNEKIVVFAFDSSAAFCVLQSRCHETWARFLSTTLKDDLQYTPSACFETFPFPLRWHENAICVDVGSRYLSERAAIMAAHREGLTDLYNRFHDPDDRDPGIDTLRSLHDELDRAVLASYGWSDIAPTCEFLLDYEDPDGDASSSRRRKPYRYRWPDEVRDEVLARLLALNRERARLAVPAVARPLQSTLALGGQPRVRRSSGMEKQVALAALQDRIDAIQGASKNHHVVELVVYPDLAVAASTSTDARAIAGSQKATFRIPRNIEPSRGHFAVQVEGDSMTPDIPPGSWCLMRRPAVPTDGKIFAFEHHTAEDADRGGKYHLKRYRAHGPSGGPELISSNPTHPPIPITSEDYRALAEFVRVIQPAASGASCTRRRR